MSDHLVMILWEIFHISYLLFSRFPEANFAVSLSKGKNLLIFSTEMGTFQQNLRRNMK